MRKLVVASNRPDAGKTSIIVGIASNIKTKFGYVKPYGDRLKYMNKVLWDNDSELMTGLFGLDEKPENLSLGYDHSKLRYNNVKGSIKKELVSMVETAGKGSGLVFIEAPKDFFCASSVNLDAMSVCKAIDGEILFVVTGNNDRIVDDLINLKKLLKKESISCAGVIINKVRDIDLFRSDYLKEITHTGLTVLGILPEDRTLVYPTVATLAEKLVAKVIAGEKGLTSQVNNIFVGAMSGTAVARLNEFRKKGKLIITSGDRSDMILAAIETNSSGIVLTNNIMPPANILAKASEKNIPILLVPSDTYQTAKKVDTFVPPLSLVDKRKISKLTEMVKDEIDLTIFK